tara:strand:+ start:1250 stop:1795 length:546 start_codon:yes stop_codon:yes gene_type:complete
MDKLRLLFVIGPVAWFSLKYYGLGSWTWETSTKIGILLNLAFLTLIAASATHNAYKRHRTDFLYRWKGAARTTLIYALIIPAALGCWYYGYASQALKNRQELQNERVEQQIMDDDNFAQLIATNPQLKDEERATIIERQQSNIAIFFSPVFYLGMATLAWSFIGLIVSAVFALIWPRIWGT